MLSPPASIEPITVSAFAPLFAPCSGSCSRSSTSPARSIRCASTAAGSSPAFGTRFVSSKVVEIRLRSWFARTRQVPFCSADLIPRQDRFFRSRRASRHYDPPITSRSPVDPG
jgi:hypothetical protein